MNCGCGRITNTNNVSVCVNVTKYESSESSAETKVDIALLKQRLSVLSGTVGNISSNVNNISSDVKIISGDLANLSAQLSPYLSGSFTSQQLARLKSLAEDQNYAALTGCIERYEGIKSVVYQAQIKIPEDQIQITDTMDFALVSATLSSVFTGEFYQLGSIKDPEISGGFDKDANTQAVIPVSGFILGMWINPINENNPDKMESFTTSAIMYKHETDTAQLFLTRAEVQNIYNQRFGKMKICALRLTK